jgi:4-amino-4-deoxy-L-arabinose transferase-like glycosyltransferase
MYSACTPPPCPEGPSRSFGLSTGSRSVLARAARRGSSRPTALLAIALSAWAVGQVLTAPSLPLGSQPGPDSIEYAEGAWQLAHGHGYFVTYDEHTGRFGDVGRPPRYPIGTSLALAPFAALIPGFPHGVQVGAKALTALYVLAVIAAAWILGGSLAGALAALLVGSSPFGRMMAGLILSDPLAAMLSVAMLIALSLRHRAGAVAAGMLAGALVCVRLLGVVALPAALWAVRGQRRRLLIAAGALPFYFALGLYQWLTFGSPLRTGYSYWLPGLREFAAGFAIHHTPLVEGPFVVADKLHGSLLSAVCPCGAGGSMSALPNLAFYPAVLVGLFWVFAPPLTGVVGMIQLVRRRQTAAARYGIATVVLSTLIVLFYFDQAARFAAPAASILLVYGASGLGEGCTWGGQLVRRRWGSSSAGGAGAAPARGASR